MGQQVGMIWDRDVVGRIGGKVVRASGAVFMKLPCMKRSS